LNLLGIRRVCWLLLVFTCLTLSGCTKSTQEKIVFETEFQAVLLDTGAVYFGKLSNVNDDYPELKDIYYIKNETNPTTKEVRNLLVKRGNELHKPTSMRLNAKHIVAVETISADSKVSQMIKEAAKQQGDSSLKK